MRTKLEPCPFCRGDVIEESVCGVRMFRCLECGALVSFDTPYYNSNPEKTFEAWNRREKEYTKQDYFEKEGY